MEEKNVKIFYKPIDGGELKELECVAESDGFEFKPLEEPIDGKYDPTPFTKSKWQKKQVAMIDGKPVKHLRYDYLGCYYWIK